MATAPKSDGIYRAAGKAWRSAKKHGSLMPPTHSVNAPTQLMKEQGYGKGYIYDHDTEDGFAGQNHFPDDLPRQRVYKIGRSSCRAGGPSKVVGALICERT